MSETLPDWPRQYYKQGKQLPFLFYVVFGTDIENLKVSRTKHRCNGIPQGLSLFSYGHETHPEVLDDFRSGYLWNELCKTDPELAEAISSQEKCIILRGDCVDESTLNYFRDAIGLITALLECNGVAVYDPQSFKWWSRSEWVSTAFEPASPQPREHVVILVSEDEQDTHWYHTRGLRKFGRPDISLRTVPSIHREAVVDLFERFIEYQAFGGIIEEGQEIKMKALPAGMFCMHCGDEDDPDFNNFHVEIEWP